MRTNLPAQRSSFIGRKRALETLRALLRRGRLVTLVGAPGVGKTRLALQHALACAAKKAYPGGVWLVDARAVRSGTDLATAVAGTLGLEVPPRSRVEVIVGRRLAERGALLLVLDEFDHAVSRAASTVDAWHAVAPEARFLVTSCAPLSIDGEQRMELGPLELGPTREAVGLFVERARSLRAGYAPGAAARRAIEEIVRRLDGNPLAIELAAARLSTVSERELLAWLPRAWSDDGARASHETPLHRAIARSWELLAARERRALAALSVFSGGFTLDAAARVLAGGRATPAALQVLQALREKSLVHVVETRAHTTRFGVYESIAAFVRAKLRALGLAKEAERKHAAYFVPAAEAWATAVRDGSAAAMDELTVERENLAAVVRRGLGPRATHAAHVEALRVLVAEQARVLATGPLAPYLARLDAAIERAGLHAPSALRVLSLLARGRTRVLSGLAQGSVDIERALAGARRLGDPVLTGQCLLELAESHRRRGCLEEAYASAADARAHFVRAESREMVGMALGQLGFLRYQQGRFDDALAHFAEQAAFLPTDLALLSAYHARVGGVYHDRGAFLAAREEYMRALVLARRARSRRREATALAVLGLLHWEMGRHAKARTFHERAIAVVHEHGDRAYEGICHASLGGLEAATGNFARSARLLDHARRLVGSQGSALVLAAVELYGAMLLLARATRMAEREPSSAAELRARARAQIVAAAAQREHVGDDVRVALRVLRTAFGEDVATARAPDCLVVDPRGASFRAPGGPAVSLARKRTLARLLVALSEHRLRAPGTSLTTFALVEAAWPGENVAALAGPNRVYVALNALRKLGLKNVITRVGDGYALDPNVRLAWGPAS